MIATNRGKVISQRDANPCKEGNALVKKMRVGRSWVQIPALARMFSQESSVKVSLLLNLYIIMYKCELNIASIVSCVYMADVPRIQMKKLF